jgi:hypothetical protein
MPEFLDIERNIGTYRAKFVALDEQYPITPKATGVEEIRWRWVFQATDPKDPDPVIDAIASPGFKQRSNNLKFLTGMLGRVPQRGDNTESLLGQEFDVDYGPNLNGRNTIVNVRRITPVAPQSTAGMTASEDAQAHKAGADKAAAQNAAQETATFRDTEVPVTDPTEDPLPF